MRPRITYQNCKSLLGDTAGLLEIVGSTLDNVAETSPELGRAFGVTGEVLQTLVVVVVLLLDDVAAVAGVTLHLRRTVRQRQRLVHVLLDNHGIRSKHRIS